MLVRITENVVGCTVVTPKKSQSHDRYKKLLTMAIFEYDISLNGIENSSLNFEKKVNYILVLPNIITSCRCAEKKFFFTWDVY